MSNYLWDGGGFDSGGSSFDNVNNYNTYRQSGGGGGGGSPSGRGRGGCITAIIIFGVIAWIVNLISGN